VNSQPRRQNAYNRNKLSRFQKSLCVYIYIYVDGGGGGGKNAKAVSKKAGITIEGTIFFSYIFFRRNIQIRRRAFFEEVQSKNKTKK
jgi:hypothetical protein